MKTSRRNGGQYDIGRLGVIVAGGGYASACLDAIEAIGHKFKTYAWARNHFQHACLDFIEISETIDILKKDNITHVVNIGPLSKQLMTYLRLVDDRKRSQSKIDKGEKFSDRPHIFYKKFERHLGAADIITLSAADFMEDYRPDKGYMGKIRRDEGLFTRLARLKKQAKTVCSSDLFNHISQAVVFDNGVFVKLDTKGTDDMLQSLQPKPAGAERILVIALPKQFPAKLRPPAVGPQTVLFAKEAGIDVIAIDVATGLIIGKELTAQYADAANIALVGI